MVVVVAMVAAVTTSAARDSAASTAIITVTSGAMATPTGTARAIIDPFAIRITAGEYAKSVQR
ncbi:hypothetical protein DES53_11417 [Roseimicrobium gellanilyticum]|uniref:Uncharacterized protein n=1 Tax=Roseimicrobium gellanilyticum TaxID=748857 RepID=A0A366H5E6_9BACT|nr:hypothetical protein DES53_11417 [Roseimicrobium gellanilyticum]